MGAFLPRVAVDGEGLVNPPARGAEFRDTPGTWWEHGATDPLRGGVFFGAALNASDYWRPIGGSLGVMAGQGSKVVMQP